MRVVISGTVGVGKSTTTRELMERLQAAGWEVNHLTERTADSPYLIHYYDEPAKWAFIAQMDFLLERFKDWLVDEEKRAEQVKEGKKVITVYDRHFIDDYIFAELHSIKESISHINSIVYQTVYKELLDKLVETNTQPDFFFLLEADLSTIVSRLHARGREAESHTDEAYWKELYDSYYVKPKFKYHFEKYNRNVMPIDTENKTPAQVADELFEIINK